MSILKKSIKTSAECRVEDMDYFNNYIRVVAGWLSRQPSSEA